ncbi:MAG: YdcF family protein [bacterium]|nr:YdcF family protein [bacterium]
MKKIDVVIVLGGGIDRQGRILQAPKERLDGFLRNKEKFPGIPVLLSGRWSGLAKETPKITEAQAMKDYLVSKRVKTKRIYRETKSLDTISNAVFSKQVMENEKHRSWKRILLITSDWHMR